MYTLSRAGLRRSYLQASVPQTPNAAYRAPLHASPKTWPRPFSRALCFEVLQSPSVPQKCSVFGGRRNVKEMGHFQERIEEKTLQVTQDLPLVLWLPLTALDNEGSIRE